MEKGIDKKKTSKEEQINLIECPASYNKKQIALTTIITIISNMEKDIGMVNEEIIFDGLRERHGIGKEDATKLINIHHKNFTVYSPKSGYYKIS